MNIYVLTVFFACVSVVASCNKPYYPANLLGEWSDWSECSATCDLGTQQRKRECNGAPEDCDGDLEEERACPDLPRCKGTVDEFNYDEETFGEKVANKPHFIMFFAPWCGHCKRLKPTWEDLSSKYNDKDEEEQDVLIGKVDCTVERSLCSAQDVNGYPTLKFFKSGTNSGVKYYGQRDLSSLVKFINMQMVTREFEQKIEEPQDVIEENGKRTTGAGNDEL